MARYMPMAGRSAQDITFENAVKNRERRLSEWIPGSDSGGVLPDESWDALWGGVDRAREAANEQGRDFRLSTSGLGGNGAQSMPFSMAGADFGNVGRNRVANAAIDEDLTRFRLSQAAVKKAQAEAMADEDAARNAATDRTSIDYAFGDPSLSRDEILKRVPGRFRQQVESFYQSKDKARADLDMTERKQSETERHNQAIETGVTDDLSRAVQGMKDGSLPPQLPGRASKDYTKILAEAHRQGYDLARAATDWAATQKHINTMNGAQQLRLNQAVNALPEMLDSVDALATKWAGGKFPLLNKASLAAAKGGAYGAEAASIANQLDAQIADVTADLGNVYMGGNSPTDHALSLAGKSLKGEWDEKVLHDMVALAKQNVQIRRNSINNTGVAGASTGNPYGPPAPAAAPAVTPGAVEEWVKDLKTGKFVKKGGA